MKVIPASLCTIRELSGLSQTALAQRSGVSQGRISELETGTRGRREGRRSGAPLDVRPSTAKALADALGVPLAALTLPDAVEVA